MVQNLEAAFHEAMINIYERAKNECRYTATRFLQLVNERGGLLAARQLLHSTGFSDGITRLWQENRLDISMEALVRSPRWRSLFTDEEIGIAEKRLRDLKYTGLDA